MKRSLFNTRGKLLAVCSLLSLGTHLQQQFQKLYATTYTTMVTQGNIIRESLKDAVALAQCSLLETYSRLTQVTVMALKAEIQVLPTLDSKREIWLGQLPCTLYLKNGVYRLLLFVEHEDPSIKTRVQRAVDANACCIISLHYNAGPPSATGSEVLVPHR